MFNQTPLILTNRRLIGIGVTSSLFLLLFTAFLMPIHLEWEVVSNSASYIETGEECDRENLEQYHATQDMPITIEETVRGYLTDNSIIVCGYDIGDDAVVKDDQLKELGENSRPWISEFDEPKTEDHNNLEVDRAF